MKLTLAAFLLALAGLNASASVISLIPSTLTPTVGQSFTIDLAVTSNTDEILGFGLNTSLSTAAIGMTGATENPFFGGDLLLGNPQYSAITFPGNTASSVTLISFSFIANSAGPSVFSVISNLQDPDIGPFVGLFLLNSTVDLSRSVTINVASAVPEPATFALAALTLVFTWGRRFRLPLTANHLNRRNQPLI